jgi:hypothetical protein
MRTYIEPKVERIDGTEADLSFYVWLKSRMHVIRLKDGTPIKDVAIGCDMNTEFVKELVFVTDEGDYFLSNKSSGKFINEFYVDKELVEYATYRRKIMAMNLQYSNFDQYVFEIQGSALFRDLLFNINTVAQWARSERFRVSTLDKEARLKEENYPISAEYKNVPEWEAQFDEYMEYLHKYEKTDDARLKMPYSISSVYWISINRKELVNLASMVKLKMPFFYDIYIEPMMRLTHISELELHNYVDSTLSMYFGSEEFHEHSTLESGFYIIQSKMGLIMYSQFLRQGSTICAGFYNELAHDDTEKFRSKVFKGDTILNITYVAHKDRLDRTVSNRLCAFAMSSGDGPCSWSYFLNNFLRDGLTPDEFRNLLPCKFKDGRVCDCKFLEDVKFRNSGTEISNDPCPLPSASLELAKRKLATDKNKIGQLYYDLVVDMNK